MKLSTQWIEYSSGPDAVSAYRTRAAGVDGELPGVVVIQEVWGADAHICDVADRFATAGYQALAPDLYSRGGRPPNLEPVRIEQAKAFLDTLPPAAWMDPSARTEALAGLPPDRGRQIGETLGALLTPERPIERYLADLRAAVAFLGEDPGCDGRVASIGFCLGGALSGLLACTEPALAAAVIFYGTAPPVERVVDVACPVLGFYGGEDARVNAGVPGLVAAMRADGKDFEAIVYAGAPHAFFNDTRASYRPAAARAAWARTLSFLTRLAPAPTIGLESGTGG